MSVNVDVVVCALLESNCCWRCEDRYIRLLKGWARPASRIVREMLSCTPQQRESARALLVDDPRTLGRT